MSTLHKSLMVFHIKIYIFVALYVAFTNIKALKSWFNEKVVKLQYSI